MKRVKVQQSIIDVLREIKRRENKSWVSVHIIILMVYRPHQIDPTHSGYRGRFWNYRQAEATAVFRAIKSLEKKKRLERRRVKAKDRYDFLPEDRRWGGVQIWTEIKLRGEE